MAIAKPLFLGVLAVVLMLSVFFGVVGAITGWSNTLEQFAAFWYYIIALALGFGIQIGLYTYLRQIIRHPGVPGKMVAVSGTTSTAAMISCCAHYLVNVLPVIGVTGFIALVAQYQVQLFWVGLLFNLAGILYIAPRVVKAYKEHKK